MELLILSLVIIGVLSYVILGLLAQITTLSLLVKSHSQEEFLEYNRVINPTQTTPEENEEFRLKSIDELTPEELSDMKILS